MSFNGSAFSRPSLSSRSSPMAMRRRFSARRFSFSWARSSLVSFNHFATREAGFVTFLTSCASAAFASVKMGPFSSSSSRSESWRPASHLYLRRRRRQQQVTAGRQNEVKSWRRLGYHSAMLLPSLSSR